MFAASDPSDEDDSWSGDHRELRDRLVALTDGAEEVLRPGSLEDTRRHVCALAARVLPADAYAVWSLDLPSGVWEAGHAVGLSPDFASQRIPGTELAFGEPLIADDLGVAALAHRREAYEAEGIRSLISVPLPIDGVRRGALVAYFRTPHSTRYCAASSAM